MMILLVVVLCVLSFLLGLVAAKFPFTQAVPAVAKVVASVPKPAEDVVVSAIQDAFSDCGLGVHHLHPEFDLHETGKLHEVLYHASKRLGATPITKVEEGLRTVADVAHHLRMTV